MIAPLPLLLLRASILSLLLLLGAAPQLSAQALKRGLLTVVVTTASGEPLRGAQVIVEGTGVARITNLEGVTVIEDLDPGARVIRVRSLGYEPQDRHVQIPSEQGVTTRFALQVRPLALVGITVTANRSQLLEATGFYARKGYGLGSFLTREQIERRNPRSVSDLLRLVAGVRLNQARFGDYSASMARSTGSRCDIEYYLDGVPTPMLNIDAMLPTDVEGIEIYRGPSQVPARFRGRGGMCGVIVIWTRIS